MKKTEIRFIAERTLITLPAKPRLPSKARIRNVLGPALPHDAEAYGVPTDTIPKPLVDCDLPVLHHNYEEGHTGALTVFGTRGGSVDFDAAYDCFCLYCMKSHLGYGDRDTDEVIFFTPGMRTYHEPREPDEVTGPTRMVYYTRVLNGLRMMHMNMGTSMDQDAIVIDKSFLPFLSWVASLLPKEISPTTESGDLQIVGPQFDALQTVASELHVFDNPVKANYRRLFSCGTPVVLMCYSRASIEVAAALREYYDSNPCERRRALLKNVTVVTIGSASRRFVDGPRYIHVASKYDPLTNYRGASKVFPKGGGKHAVYLACNTPYPLTAFDNHNFGALVVQYLTLVMHLSGVDSFRKLWRCAHDGKLVEPTDDEVFAMVTLTRGYEQLWDPDLRRKTKLPSRSEAKRILRQRCSEEWLWRIRCLLAKPNLEDVYAEC